MCLTSSFFVYTCWRKVMLEDEMPSDSAQPTTGTDWPLPLRAHYSKEHVNTSGTDQMILSRFFILQWRLPTQQGENKTSGYRLTHFHKQDIPIKVNAPFDIINWYFSCVLWCQGWRKATFVDETVQGSQRCELQCLCCSYGLCLVLVFSIQPFLLSCLGVFDCTKAE